MQQTIFVSWTNKGGMEIEYIDDTGSRHEWSCLDCDTEYIVAFHYLDRTWTAQRVRDDGEREVLDRDEAQQLLSQFPSEEALRMTGAGPAAFGQVKYPEHQASRGETGLGRD